MRQLLRFSTATLLVLLPALPAHAQGFPAKPVKIIVPVSAGGPTDVLTRVLGQKLAESWGQPLVVDNRAGGGSNIGFELAAKSPADGYTLLMAQPAFTVNVSLYKKLGYDPLRDFAPVSLVTTYPLLLVSHPSVPARSVKELVAIAKANPGQLNCVSSGNGTTTHLAVEWFKTVAGVNLIHVPYKGAAPAITDLIGGHADLMFVSPPTVLTQIQQGRLRALAITSSARYHLLPGIATFTESGYPGFVVMGWYGLLAPAGTPRDVVMRLNADVVKALGVADVKERLSALGLDPVGSTPEQFTAWIKDEITRWSGVVKTSGAKPD